jgi:hypothetical protein
MRRVRSRRSFALIGLAVVVFAAIVPVVTSDLHDVMLAPLWLFPATVSLMVVRRTATRCQHQPPALLSLALFRAPPSTLA